MLITPMLMKSKILSTYTPVQYKIVFLKYQSYYMSHKKIDVCSLPFKRPYIGIEMTWNKDLLSKHSVIGILASITARFTRI